MTTAITDLHSLFYRGKNSKTTTTRPGIANINTGSQSYVIHQDVEIHLSVPSYTAKVIQPFVVEVTPKDDEWMATSPISNIFEFGTTPGLAVMNYLSALTEGLIWLQQQKATLSPAIQEELYLLQRYLQIV